MTPANQVKVAVFLEFYLLKPWNNLRRVVFHWTHFPEEEREVPTITSSRPPYTSPYAVLDKTPVRLMQDSDHFRVN